MVKIPIGLKKADVSLVSDGSYFSTLSGLLKSYRQTIWGSLFIVDLNTGDKNFLKVHQLLVDLKNAEWEGTDVKLIISGSKDNLEIASTSLASSYLIEAMGLPCKTFMTKGEQTSHMKMVIIDDMILLGSHNWSPGAFGNQHQDSILVKNKEFAAYCKVIFNTQWYYKNKS